MAKCGHKLSYLGAAWDHRLKRGKKGWPSVPFLGQSPVSPNSSHSIEAIQTIHFFQFLLDLILIINKLLFGKKDMRFVCYSLVLQVLSYLLLSYVCLAVSVQNFLVFVFLHKIAEFITCYHHLEPYHH